jgi:hypothetical protein
MELYFKIRASSEVPCGLSTFLQEGNDAVHSIRPCYLHNRVVTFPHAKIGTLNHKIIWSDTLSVCHIMITSVFIELSLFWINEISLRRSPCCLCACVSMRPLLSLLNGWTSFYETWYVHHGTWAHLIGTLFESLPSLCLHVYPPFVARQWLSNNITAAMNTHTKIQEFLDPSFSTRSVSYEGQ